jgi:hypothetical protein
MAGMKKIVFLLIFLCFCMKLDVGLAEQQQPFNDDWKRNSFRVIGGGACYFNILYDIDSGTF